MKDYLLNFEEYLKNTKKSSKNTLESYLRDVSQFTEYCNTIKIKSVTDINFTTIESYSKYLEKSNKAASSISRAVASIRCYLTFLKSDGIVTENAAVGFKTAKKERKFPEVLTAREVTQILSQPNGSDYKSCRDKAMLELLYATGIKVSELVALKLNDVNVQVGIVALHTDKNSRLIPLYPDAVKAVKDYISIRNAIVPDDQSTMFTNLNGQPLTRQGFWKIIKGYAQKANIKKDITPHTIRHSFAAHLLENGAPLQDIQEMLGHSDISSTQIYAQMLKNKYSQSYKRFHPLANKSH